MNRTTTDTPLAQVTDYVLDLQQPNGHAQRLCVSCPSSGPLRPVFDFLESLALCGLVGRGGGSPVRTREQELAKKMGLVMDTDADGPPMEDPFSDPDDPFSDGYTPPFTLSRQRMDTIAFEVQSALRHDPDDVFAEDRPGLNFRVENGEVVYTGPNSGSEGDA